MAQLNRRYINLHEIQEMLEQNEILSEQNEILSEQNEILSEQNEILSEENTKLWLFVEHCKKVLNYNKQGEQLGIEKETN